MYSFCLETYNLRFDTVCFCSCPSFFPMFFLMFPNFGIPAFLCFFCYRSIIFSVSQDVLSLNPSTHPTPKKNLAGHHLVDVSRNKTLAEPPKANIASFASKNAWVFVFFDGLHSHALIFFQILAMTCRNLSQTCFLFE